MAAETLFSGEFPFHYGQFYVESGVDEGRPDLSEAFAGQSNGLCGAAAPGFLWFITGLHTGTVALTAELHRQPPPVSQEWQEIVEVSFTPQWSHAWLVEWNGERWLLDLDEVSYGIAAADSATQRAVARWAARRACVTAGLADIGWVAQALEALDHGQPLPPPFDNHSQAWARLHGDQQIPHTLVTWRILGMRQQALALPAIFAAAETGPLQAALDAVYAAAATYGSQYQALLAEIRHAFPAIPSA